MQVLASAEFYDLDTQQWETVGSMQVTRTEHLITLVYKAKDKDKDKGKDNYTGCKDRACDQPGLRPPHGHRWRQRWPVHLLDGAV